MRRSTTTAMILYLPCLASSLLFDIIVYLLRRLKCHVFNFYIALYYFFARKRRNLKNQLAEVLVLEVEKSNLLKVEQLRQPIHRVKNQALSRQLLVLVSLHHHPVTLCQPRLCPWKHWKKLHCQVERILKVLNRKQKAVPIPKVDMLTRFELRIERFL